MAPPAMPYKDARSMESFSSAAPTQESKPNETQNTRKPPTRQEAAVVVCYVASQQFQSAGDHVSGIETVLGRYEQHDSIATGAWRDCMLHACMQG